MSNLKSLTTTLFLFLYLLLLLPSHVHSKTSSGTVLLTGQKTEHLLSKFSTTSTSKLTLHLSIPTSTGMYTDERYLKLHFFVDEKWTEARGASTCREKVEHSALSLPVVFDMRVAEDGGGESLWVADVDTMFGGGREMGTMKDGDGYWYITIDDCSLEETYHSKQDAPRMNYHYTLLNNNDDGSTSHFSADQRMMPKLHVVQFLTSSLLLLWVGYRVMKMINSPRSQIHVAAFAVTAAVLCDVMSSACELIHLAVYSSDGVGSYTFDALSSHFEAQCDAMVAIVLLLVGSGWTLPGDVTTGNADGTGDLAMMGTRSTVRELILGMRDPFSALRRTHRPATHPAVILVLSVILSHVILAQWGRTFDDEFDTYHSLEHMPGTVLMMFRASLGSAFVVGVTSLRNGGRCPASLRPFLNRFLMVGSAWFVSLPFVSTFVSTAVRNGNKHVALEMGSFMVQVCSLCSLIWLFTADEDASAYHRLSKARGENLGLLAGSGVGVSSNVWKIGRAKVRLD